MLNNISTYIGGFWWFLDAFRCLEYNTEHLLCRTDSAQFFCWNAWGAAIANWPHLKTSVCEVNCGDMATADSAIHWKNLGSLKPTRLVDISPCQPALAKAHAKLAKFNGLHLPWKVLVWKALLGNILKHPMVQETNDTNQIKPMCHVVLPSCWDNKTLSSS